MCLFTNCKIISIHSSGEVRGVEKRKRDGLEVERYAVKDLGCPFHLYELKQALVLCETSASKSIKQGIKAFTS